MQTIHLKRGSRSGDIRTHAKCNIPAICTAVNEIKYDQKNYHIEYQYREQTQTPGKWNSSHKSHQKWRITDWCQTSTHIGNQENEKDHNMTLISSPGIHLNHRTHQKHTCTSCTDTA